MPASCDRSVYASDGGALGAGGDSSLVSLRRAPDNPGISIEARRLDLLALPDGILSELHAYWVSKCSGARLPARRDLDPLDFQRALGRVCLLEVARSPLVFRYRLDGSLLAEHRRRDMTGRTTDETTPLALANVLRAEYSRVVHTAAPNFFEVVCAREMTSATLSILALPLAADGTRVDMLLTCILGTENLRGAP